MLVLAEAEPFNTVEGNMDCAVMRGAVALPGSETISRQKGTRRNLGGLTADHRPTGRPGPRREGEEPKPMMHGREKSGLAVVAMKPANQAGKPAAELVEPRAGPRGGRSSTTRPGHSAGLTRHRRWSARGKRKRWPLLTRGGSRMRESRTYGSVRGAGSNARPYRDRVCRRRQGRSVHSNRVGCGIEPRNPEYRRGRAAVFRRRQHVRRRHEALSPCRGLRPHHARKDRVGTWEISRPTTGRWPSWSACGRRRAEAHDERG